MRSNAAMRFESIPDMSAIVAGMSAPAPIAVRPPVADEIDDTDTTDERATASDDTTEEYDVMLELRRRTRSNAFDGVVEPHRQHAHRHDAHHDADNDGDTSTRDDDDEHGTHARVDDTDYDDVPGGSEAAGDTLIKATSASRRPELRRNQDRPSARFAC
jgi:hypothetical protein